MVRNGYLPALPASQPASQTSQIEAEVQQSISYILLDSSSPETVCNHPISMMYHISLTIMVSSPVPTKTTVSSDLPPPSSHDELTTCSECMVKAANRQHSDEKWFASFNSQCVVNYSPT